jgi:hypothetical protein
MSRRVYLLGVGLALLALGLAFTDWALSLQPGVTEANARRIRAGMTLAEVEAILGGRYSELILGRPCRVAAASGHTLPPTSWTACWDSDSGVAFVNFDRGDQVKGVVFMPSEADGPPPFSRLRAWLGW